MSREGFDPGTPGDKYDKMEQELIKVKEEGLGEKTKEEIEVLLAKRERLISELETLKGEEKEQADEENKVFNHAPERRQTLTTAIRGHESRIEDLKKGLENLNKEIEEITGKKISTETEEEREEKNIPDIETIQKANQQFLFNTFKKWYSEADAQKAKQRASFQNPETLDYSALSQDIDASKFGEYTLNPDTQQIDFETLRPVIIDLPQFVGKKRSEVMKHIIDTYGATHHIPGIEYWKWIIENPDKTSHNLKDGNWHFFPASVLRDEDGHWSVPFVLWNVSEFLRAAGWLGLDWGARERVVLFEKEKKKAGE